MSVELSPREFGERFRQAVGGPESPEAVDNQKQAASELEHIFALVDNEHFAWFEKTCLEALYRDALDDLTDPEFKTKTLLRRKIRFDAVSEIRNWLIKREITNRETKDGDDPQIARLRAKLRLH